MNPHDLKYLQEAYMEVYDNELDESYKELPYEKMMQQASKIKKQAPYRKRREAAKTAKRILDVASEHNPDLVKLMPKLNLNFGKYERGRKSRTQSEEVDIYDIILSHLIDEGYADCLGSAEIILENMSDEWLDDILEGFVDPERGQAPSGRSPIENVSYHPKKSVRGKAMGAFAHQMGKEYGGKFKAKTKDPTKD